MRQHDRFAQLVPYIDAERFHRVVHAEHLAAARLDTGFSARIDNYGTLDLVFVARDEIQVVPFIVVQGLMLFLREASPFVWPAWLPPTRGALVREIEAAVEPWLRSLAVARFVNGEAVKFFDCAPEFRELFARVRALGFVGAAATEDAIVAVSPYVFAQRFAAGGRVAIADVRGAGGAAILARRATVHVDLGDRSRNEDAGRWFGPAAFEKAIAEGPYELAIGDRAMLPKARVTVALEDAGNGERTVRVAQPIPLSVMVSFDVGDGDEVRRFAVAAPAVTLREHAGHPTPIIGGSAGRIGLVVRDDYLGVPDADGDAALALADHLNAQGFTARVVGASHVRSAEFDLLHVFGYRCAGSLAGALARAEGARPPIVIQPYLDDPKCEAEWGSAVTAESLANAADEALRATYAGAIANRRLAAKTVPEIGTSAANEPIVRNLLAAARGGVFASDEEERRAREAGFSGTASILPAILADEPAADERIGSLVGLDEFVLVHAPLDARCNQYAIVRACAQLGYPVVLLGSVTNTEYYGDVVAALDHGGMWLPQAELSPAEVAALYRRARVFADVSWSAAGLYRLTRAAAAGAALVVPASGFARVTWPGHAQAVDPASGPSIEQGLRTAWERAGEIGPAVAARTLEKYRPFDMLVLTLNAYQSAATLAPS